MKRNLCSIRVNYKVAVLFILLIIPRGFLHSQVANQPDYKEIFGEQYSEAINYLNQNRWITTSLLRNNIDPCFAKSIIFPELIRYSYLKDKMEIQALKTLYVQYGRNYANFSVGRFQIKPSFAEKLEIDLNQLSSFRFDNELKNIDTTQSSQARLERVKRLESTKWQLQYLIWFLKLSEEKFKNLRTMPEAEKLKFLATAYNFGYDKPAVQILENSRHKYFHTDLFSGKNLYNYSDISLHYRKNCINPD